MRCFIAAWPDASTRLALSALLDDVRQRVEHRRATRADDLHLTLAFIGDLADDGAYAVADAAAALRFEPVQWQLDRLGFFEEAGAVWAGTEIGNEACQPLLKLAELLRQGLDQLNIDYDRRPLAPHVTLLRGVKRFAAERIESIHWRIDSIALYRSANNQSGPRYARVAR